MAPDLDNLLEQRGGVLLRSEAVAAVPVHRFERAVRRGELRRVFPRAYVAAESFLDPEVRRRAGLVSVGPGAALSHLSGLAQWGLQPALDPWLGDQRITVPDVHVTVGDGRHPRARDGLVPHRRRALTLTPADAVVRGDMPTLRLERCLVESWPLVPEPDRRAAAIRAVRERRTTPDRLLAAAAELPRLPDRATLLGLIALLADGCHSELEIWGHLNVFTNPAMPAVRRQLPVRVRDTLYYLDLAVEGLLLAIELDGRRHHSSPLDVERDHRRDVALATLGWQTLRFSHRRLHEDPVGVLREVLAVVGARRRFVLGA